MNEIEQLRNIETYQIQYTAAVSRHSINEAARMTPVERIAAIIGAKLPIEGSYKDEQLNRLQNGGLLLKIDTDSGCRSENLEHTKGLKRL